MVDTNITSRRWDGEPETDADRRFFDLRDTGYQGPIDHDGYPIPADRVREHLQHVLTGKDNAMTPTAPEQVALLTVLANSVSPQDNLKLKVEWLLDLAAALDALTTDGAVDLADVARKTVLSLVGNRLDYVAGKSR